jgi:hypothetical protein
MIGDIAAFPKSLYKPNSIEGCGKINLTIWASPSLGRSNWHWIYFQGFVAAPKLWQQFTKTKS